MVSLLGETEGKEMEQWGRERERKRGREDMAARGFRVGLRETSHTKCPIRVKSRSVCLCNAEESIVSNGTLLRLCQRMILCVSV